MANSKLKTLPSLNAAGLQPELELGCARDNGPSVEEGLRLIHAFARIEDPGRRAWLLKQVQQFADMKSTMQ